MSTQAITKPEIAGKDLYHSVNNRIISLLESGVIPWRITWNKYGLARNYVTKHIYSGINLLLMNHTEHPIPYFMTWKQIQDAGARVKKGAKAHPVIYFNIYFKDASDKTISIDEAKIRKAQGEEIQVLKFIKYYNTFNIEDIDNMEFEIPEVQLLPHQKIEQCESIITNMPQKPKIKNIDANRAFYSPTKDFVNMPAIEQFESPEAYYATFFHELCHATGHISRLARPALLNPQTFANIQYSEEEIIAEMGASFLCAATQIDYNEIIENSAAYLQGWLKVLNEDKTFIFKASAEAQKAADFILGNLKNKTISN